MLVQTTVPITSFRAPFGFLSNFYPCRVELDGIMYESVEIAYQSAKCAVPAARANFIGLTNSAEAKRIGRLVRIRPDWTTAKKLEVMTDLVAQKFDHPELGEMLLATGHRQLIEVNTWDDTFWGVCDGEGMNHLGMILMQVRAVLRAAQ